jgi:hypothetical protein
MTATTMSFAIWATSIPRLPFWLVWLVCACSGSLRLGSEAGDAPLDILALAMLGWANGSQAYMDLRIRKDGRWEVNEFEIITIMDTVFAALDFVNVVVLLGAGPV